ncbi:MAG: DUF2817 domain-containing protein [Alphaproteobacteria bacterium]|nr:DUF2817 domain-containing protein [Alphaproteobacteria bacterium]
MSKAPHDYFAPRYNDARQKFLTAAEQADAVITNHVHPLKGPDGEPLSLDVAAFGPLHAKKVFVTMSATHGGEGFLGSAAQVGWLTEKRYQDIPDDTAVILMHAVNPHGFAWLRRVTEGNVDLNRNFLDYAEPVPEKPEYDKLHAAICPDDWTDESLAAADKVLDEYAEEHGQKVLNRVVMSGQFNRPDGLFYGGTAPTWSRAAILATLDTHAVEACHVALIDFHTGLGPSGHGESYIVGNEGDPGVEKANDVWGTEDVTILAASGPKNAHDGYNLSGIARELAPIPFYGNTLEFGTHPLDIVYRALRADNWLHLHGDLNSDFARSVKADLKEAFAPDSAEWRETVYDRCMEVWKRGMMGLAGL